MKGNIGIRFREALGIGITGALLLVSSTNTSVATGSARDDVCEREALQAYTEALKLCQLAETQNPRLKCFEAAKAVYLRTLEDCRNRQK